MTKRKKKGGVWIRLYFWHQVAGQMEGDGDQGSLRPLHWILIFIWIIKLHSPVDTSLKHLGL